MSSDCCFAAYEPALAERTRCHPDDGVCHDQLFAGEPCVVATGAHCCDNKMAADDETTRALDYIREMCLDRPCPGCKSEVIDKPQDDLRQCRACGHVWGFDDTQNLEDFVREFGRMQPCIVCGNDSLDEFEVVENRGRQELICSNCHSVQGTERLERDRICTVQDFDVIPMDREGYRELEPDFPDPRQARELACPFCPEITNDFFEKEFDHDELVRVVCPGCSYVVFFKEQDNGLGDRRYSYEHQAYYRRVPEDGRRAQEDGVNARQRRTDGKREQERQREEADDKDEIQPLSRGKRALRYLKVKPIELVQRTLQEYEESVREGDGPAPRLRTVVAQQAPVMGEQLGWTIGTAVGNIVFKNPDGANFTGTVGSIIGREVCDMVLKTVRRRKT